VLKYPLNLHLLNSSFDYFVPFYFLFVFYVFLQVMEEKEANLGKMEHKLKNWESWYTINRTTSAQAAMQEPSTSLSSQAQEEGLIAVAIERTQATI
jgi:hypothetical protein